MKFLLEDSILARGFGNIVANSYSVFKNPISVRADIMWNFYLIRSCGIASYYIYNVNAKWLGKGAKNDQAILLKV